MSISSRNPDSLNLTPQLAGQVHGQDLKRAVKSAFPWLMILDLINWERVLRIAIELILKKRINITIPSGYAYDEVLNESDKRL